MREIVKTFTIREPTPHYLCIAIKIFLFIDVLQFYSDQVVRIKLPYPLPPFQKKCEHLFDG